LIGRVTGRLLERDPGEILVDVGGVGYRIAVPLTTYGRLPDIGAEVSLHTHTHVREDALALYGFDARGERDLFERLIGVPGIGPRLALAVLSHLDPGDLSQAVATRDTARLVLVPGIGRKMAERLVIELEGLLDDYPLPAARSGGAAPTTGRRGDLVSALVNLGYRAAQVALVVERVLAGSEEGTPVQALLRDALRRLGSAGRESRASERPGPKASAVPPRSAGRRRAP